MVINFCSKSVHSKLPSLASTTVRHTTMHFTRKNPQVAQAWWVKDYKDLYGNSDKHSKIYSQAKILSKNATYFIVPVTSHSVRLFA